MINQYLILLISFSIIPVCLPGCAYTGNPREGGLFGWSEEAANARLYALNRERQQVEESTRLEKQRKEANLKEQQALRSQEKALQESIRASLSKNADLAKEVDVLESKNNQMSTALKRRKKELHALRQDLLQRSRKPHTEQEKQTLLKESEDLNQQYIGVIRAMVE